NQKRRLVACIAVTILCALTFLCIKYIEYSHKVHEHILFGRYFDPCVSPGNVELLTMNNECPGSKSTVKWTITDKVAGTGKADAGCFEIRKIDQDPHTPGLQADCNVTEVKLSVSKGPDGKSVEHETGSRSITERCPDPRPGEEGHEPKFPCWRPAYQPAVC